MRLTTGRVRLALITALLGTGLVALAPAAQAADGDLDPTFGLGGKVVTNIGGLPTFILGTVLQPDGKVVAAGASLGGDNFLLVRYDAGGQLDPTFGGGDGIVEIDFAGAGDAAFAVVLQPDGKLVAAGFAAVGGNSNFALARYDTSGVLDPTFGGGDGRVDTDFAGADDQALALVLQPDGKLVAAGTTGVVGNFNFALARYTASGVLDTTFGGGDGRVVTDFAGADDQAFALVLQPDGRLVAGGRATVGANRNFALARYTADGVSDTTFGGGDGVVDTDFAGLDDLMADLVIQPDGKLVAAGHATVAGQQENFALARYTGSGLLDPTFGGGDGRVDTDFGLLDDEIGALVLQADGKLVAGGSVRFGASFDFTLARYDTSGVLDLAFGGGDGIVNTDFDMDSDSVNALVVQPDGKLVAAGTAVVLGTNNFALARYDLGPGAAPTTDLAVGKAASAYSVDVGQDVTYTITVTNHGPDAVAAGGTQVSDALPGSMTFQSVSSPFCATPPVGSSGTVICPLPAIDKGSSTTIVVVARAAAAGPATDTTTVVPVSPATDTNAANNSAQATINIASGPAPPPPPGPKVADLVLTTTADKYKVEEGHHVTYTIRVKNHGPDAASAVISEQLPPNTVFAKVTGASCTKPKWGTSGTVACMVGPLAPGASASVKVKVLAKTRGFATSTSKVDPIAPATDPNQNNNTASATVKITH